VHHKYVEKTGKRLEDAPQKLQLLTMALCRTSLICCSKQSVEWDVEKKGTETKTPPLREKGCYRSSIAPNTEEKLWTENRKKPIKETRRGRRAVVQGR